jgi:hypothetical protein
MPEVSLGLRLEVDFPWLNVNGEDLPLYRSNIRSKRALSQLPYTTYR